MAPRKSDILSSLDWITIGLYFLLIILGWFNIYSAVFNEEQHESFSFATRYGRQLIWIAAAFLIIVVALVVDSKFYSSFAYVIYVAVILLLIVVLVFGTRINGAKSWLIIGPVRLQPAEFAKFATSLALAKFLSSYNLKPESFKTFLKFCLIAFLPTTLILFQNDTGSALVFVVLFLVYFREGMQGIYMLVGFLSIILFVLSLLYDNYVVIIILEILALLAFYLVRRNFKELLISVLLLVIASLGFGYGFAYYRPDASVSSSLIAALFVCSILFSYKIYKHKLKETVLILIILFASIGFAYSVDYVFHNIMDRHQQSRINHLLGIESDPFGAGYNVNQSMIAIGSGGPLGKGYLQGTQTKFKFVPEQSTDFIFCTVGEEWGFLGTSVVVILFLGLLIRLIYLAERQKSKFSRIYGYSVASILFFHVAVNIGMTIGLAPVIGIPLPFFSYGGSSLWGFTFLLFIFLKLDANRTELIT